MKNYVFLIIVIFFLLNFIAFTYLMNNWGNKKQNTIPKKNDQNSFQNEELSKKIFHKKIEINQSKKTYFLKKKLKMMKMKIF
jgi:hypothetical protein